MSKKNVFEKYNCIAVLGGTFNPMHKGHIMLAQSVIKQYEDIEKVIVMPNNKPAYKGTNEIISPKERVDMIKLSVKDYDFMEISDMEIKRGGITYTYDTLKQIYGINNNIKIYYIIGADSLFAFDKWHRYKELLGMCTLLAAKRKSNFDDMLGCIDELKKDNEKTDIRIIKSPEMDISSSAIRRFLSKYDNESYDKNLERIEKYLDKRVSAGVKEYIIEKKFYSKVL